MTGSRACAFQHRPGNRLLELLGEHDSRHHVAVSVPLARRLDVTEAFRPAEKPDTLQHDRNAVEGHLNLRQQPARSFGLTIVALPS